MFIELSNGGDNFRAQQRSEKRQVKVHVHLQTPEAEKMQYGFMCYKNKMQGYGTQKLITATPATSRVAESPGIWYLNRCEVKEKTLVLVSFQTASPHSLFNVTTYYMALLADSEAPLYNIALNLPPHFMADVNSVFFRGRFHRLIDYAETYDLLSPKQMSGLMFESKCEDEDEFNDTFDPAVLDGHFNFEMLEGTKVKTIQTVKAKNINKKTGGGVVIRRTRKLRL